MKLAPTYLQSFLAFTRNEVDETHLGFFTTRDFNVSYLFVSGKSLGRKIHLFQLARNFTNFLTFCSNHVAILKTSQYGLNYASTSNIR